MEKGLLEMVLDAIRDQHPQTITERGQDTTEELDSGCLAAGDAQESSRTPLTCECSSFGQQCVFTEKIQPALFREKKNIT